MELISYAEKRRIDMPYLNDNVNMYFWHSNWEAQPLSDTIHFKFCIRKTKRKKFGQNLWKNRSKVLDCFTLFHVVFIKSYYTTTVLFKPSVHLNKKKFFSEASPLLEEILYGLMTI